MSFLVYIRALALIGTLAAGLAMLGLGAHILLKTTTDDGAFLFAELVVAAGAATALLLAPM
jgi:hypothetical protein